MKNFRKMKDDLGATQGELTERVWRILHILWENELEPFRHESVSDLMCYTDIGLDLDPSPTVLEVYAEYRGCYDDECDQHFQFDIPEDVLDMSDEDIVGWGKKEHKYLRTKERDNALLEDARQLQYLKETYGEGLEALQGG